MSALHTEEDLAEKLRVSPRMAAEWRREFDWPCLKFKRRVRFTDEHVAEILARHEHRSAGATVTPIAGQTKRSAGRS